jgi:hypothetical protein
MPCACVCVRCAQVIGVALGTDHSTRILNLPENLQVIRQKMAKEHSGGTDFALAGGSLLSLFQSETD